MPKCFVLCFAKSIHRILKIKTYSQTLEEQYHILQRFNILPLALRHFRFSTFLFNTLKNNNTILSNSILKNVSTTKTRGKFTEQHFSKTFKQFSFSSISIKLLNLFIADHLEVSSLFILKKKLFSNIFILYSNSKKFWT